MVAIENDKIWEFTWTNPIIASVSIDLLIQQD